MTAHDVRQIVGRTRSRGSALAGHAAYLIDLATRSPIDLSGPVGRGAPDRAELREGRRGRALDGHGGPRVPDVVVELQGEMARQAVLWAELRAGLGAFAFQARWPLLDTILSATPGARWFGSNARGVEISSRLESFANAPAMAGIAAGTFWAMTPSARTSMGRLVATDLVLTRDYEYSIFTELAVLLVEGTPLQPNVEVILARLEGVRQDTYREEPVPVVRTMVITDGASVSDLAERVLGSMDRWPQTRAVELAPVPLHLESTRGPVGRGPGPRGALGTGHRWGHVPTVARCCGALRRPAPAPGQRVRGRGRADRPGRPGHPRGDHRPAARVRVRAHLGGDGLYARATT